MPCNKKCMSTQIMTMLLGMLIFIISWFASNKMYSNIVNQAETKPEQITVN